MERNTVQLIGYLGRYPRITERQQGRKRAMLRVATHDFFKIVGTQKIYKTTWHEVVAWEANAKYAEQNFVAGSRILVKGRLVYRTYIDSAGHTRYITEINASSLFNLDR